MSELIAYRRFNPSTERKVLVVRESEHKPHKVRLRGHENIGFETGANGAVDLHLPAGMRVVSDPDGTTPRDLAFKPKDLSLSPATQVTLKFYGGRVIHTVSHLPDDQQAALVALKRTHVHNI